MKMNNPQNLQINPGSFRDPDGFLFHCNGSIFRQINQSYQANYEHLMDSGLYQSLVTDGLLISHEEASCNAPKPDIAYKIIKPVQIPFISYPYEWCFSQLKSAALTTLKIQKKALQFAMSLKDCSAYNLQFINSRALFIDTLSFEKYREGTPWVAYKQFCQHFLAPLALMCHKEIRLSQLLRIYLDGIPLDLASSLLPLRTRFDFYLLTHIHLHAKSQKHFADKQIKPQTNHKMTRLAFLSLIDNLESAVQKLKWRPQGTEWADYYQDTNYTVNGFEHKKRVVAELITKTAPRQVWDLGANRGIFSRLASYKGIQTISFDLDPAAVEKNYRETVSRNEDHLLPLLLDLTNPSPGIGWNNQERASFMERGPVDTCLALALIHHLAIANNLPFPKIAQFFGKICKTLIIEFIPKLDSQVQRLLASREDIFTDYNQANFENQFGKLFLIKETVRIIDSKRTLYLMERNNA
jgi:ribosomal protein L11 methylase PrmA